MKKLGYNLTDDTEETKGNPDCYICLGSGKIWYAEYWEYCHCTKPSPWPYILISLAMLGILARIAGII